jgi:uncharacterized protein (TIGR00369 family)
MDGFIAGEHTGAMTDWDLENLTQLMEEFIPFNKFLGMKVKSISEGKCALRIPFRDELIGDPARPALHGGVTSMLIDTAGGAACFSALDAESRVSTVDLVVDYLRPGPLTDIEARARVVRAGNRVCIAMVDVYGDGDDEPFAQGRGVYNVSRSKR